MQKCSLNLQKSFLKITLPLSYPSHMHTSERRDVNAPLSYYEPDENILFAPLVQGGEKMCYT